MNNTLIHPRLAANQKNFFTDAATIQEYTEAKDAHGQPIKTWADKLVTGEILVDIDATIGMSSGEEVKQKDKTYAISTHKILLRGIYTVTEKDRAVIDSVNYDILSVDKDSKKVFTRLLTRIVIW